MQPEASNTPATPERPPVETAPLADRMPVLPAPEWNPEVGIERGAERVEQAAETRAAAADADAAIATAVQPIAVPVDDTQVSTTNDDTQTPVAAADDDVIEKEWVDHAKKIINETKGDPFKREQEVTKLQKDYLKKRYGKDLGAAPQEA